MGNEEDLIRHLTAICGLDESTLTKILGEVRAWHTMDVQAWIRDRHAELQAQGLRNRRIFPMLRNEAREMLFRAPPLSERQIRRVIYG